MPTFDVDLSGIGNIQSRTVVSLTATPVRLNPRTESSTPELSSGLFVTNPAGGTVKIALLNYRDAAPTGVDSEVQFTIVGGFDFTNIKAGKNLAVWAWCDVASDVNVARYSY